MLIPSRREAFQRQRVHSDEIKRISDNEAARNFGMHDTPGFAIGRTGSKLKDFVGRIIFLEFPGFGRMKYRVSLITSMRTSLLPGRIPFGGEVEWHVVVAPGTPSPERSFRKPCWCVMYIVHRMRRHRLFHQIHRTEHTFAFG
jgi:hypothetical protein